MVAIAGHEAPPGIDTDIETKILADLTKSIASDHVVTVLPHPESTLASGLLFFPISMHVPTRKSKTILSETDAGSKTPSSGGQMVLRW